MPGAVDRARRDAATAAAVPRVGSATTVRIARAETQPSRHRIREPSSVRFASSITASADATEAVDELLAGVEARVTPGMVDLALFFATAHFEDDMPDVVERLAAALPNAVWLGCTAAGTIGDDREIEELPSMSLLAGTLPDVTIRPFRLTQAQLDGADTHLDWERLVGVAPESDPVFLAMGDPFRVDVTGFVDKLSDAYPGAPLLGGVASAANEPGENMLFLAGDTYRDGVVGVALTGHVTVEAVVSQGCRSIGRAFVVTRGERNIIQELGGKPPLAQLQAVLSKLSDDDERLARQSLFVGQVIDEYRPDVERGNFLIHNIMGADRNTGAIAIAGPARVGTTVQFQVRDADTADHDLRHHLARYAGADIRGAALFGCNGRGTQMWDKPGHDVGALRDAVGDVPVAGFFCAGEFGPVGGRNFVHGFTATIALFRNPDHD